MMLVRVKVYKGIFSRKELCELQTFLKEFTTKEVKCLRVKIGECKVGCQDRNYILLFSVWALIP